MPGGLRTLKVATQGPDGSWVPFLSGGWKSEVGRGSASRPLSPGSPRLWDRYVQAPAKACQGLGLAGCGAGVSLASPKPLMVDYSSSNPFPPSPPGPPWRLAACVLAGLGVGGAARQLQTVRAKRQVCSRVYSAEGGGRGQGRHTPCQGPIRPHLPPPPSSSALGQNRHRPQGLVAG